MAYFSIDMEHYPRREHFNYFRSLPYPYAGVTVDVDVSSLVSLCKKNRFSFYLSFLHAAALAADEVPELRQRIHDGGIIQYDACPTSHVELLDDGTYCYCTLHHQQMTLAEFLPYAEDARRKCRTQASIEEDAAVESMYFISTVPWFHYSAIIQPAAGGDESNPRITWGRFTPDHEGKLMMPVSILVHHAIVDGIHLAAFYNNLSEKITRIIQ